VSNMEFKVANIESIKKQESEHSFSNLLVNKGNNILRDSFVLISSENSATNNLTAGYTIVYPNCRTSGHDHIEYEEIYHIIKGKGIMEVSGEKFNVKSGDTFLVPFGLYHTISNPNTEVLEYFWVLSENQCNDKE